ncbi:MAG: prepilin-type N-terminal cleavage/methylation domain-containing protein [Deltaproteobacteria bacterium]|jgi:prepilin-type N-terminal cleavage/methylation domain-containing protein|nr:prepilin-type N-terminal cleavage/methylation domain-containing protein [Deltaproteobacteria bacterium]
MSEDTGKARPGTGFTLIELLVVIGIVGILALIAYPTLSRILPNQYVSSEAKMVDGFIQKARIKAATAQRPVRVVLKCPVSDSSGEACWIKLQAAKYSDNAGNWVVTGWQDDGPRREFNDAVRLTNFRQTPCNTSDCYDGATAAPPGVRYAIFMPNGRIYSDPKPFDVFFYHRSSGDLTKPGWRLRVGADSGRVNTERAELTLNP